MSITKKAALELDKERYEEGFSKYQTLYFVKDSEYESDRISRKIDVPYLTRCFDSYLALSVFFQGLFISKSGYIVNTGNFETANIRMIELIKEKVEKHPLLWKLFFMIA